MVQSKKKVRIVLFGILLIFISGCGTKERNLPKLSQLPPKPRIGIVNLLEPEAKIVRMHNRSRLLKEDISVDWEIPDYIVKGLSKELGRRLQSEIVILPASQQIIQNRDMLYGFWPKSTDQGVNLQALQGIKDLAETNQLDVVIFILSFHKMHMLGARNVVTGVSGNTPTGFSGYGLFITEGNTSWNPGLGVARVPQMAAPFASIAIELYWTKPPYAYMGGSGPYSMGVASCANVPDFKFPANIDNMTMLEIDQIEDDLKLLIDQLVDATLINAGISQQ